MKALILAHDFPPLNSVGARRPYSWFRYFGQSGIEPVVITRSWEESSATPRDILMQKGSSEVIREVLPEGTIIRVPLSTNLPERLFIKYGDRRFRFIRRSLTFLFSVGSFPFGFLDKNRTLYGEAVRYLQQQQADVIITSGEPFILFKYGMKLSRRFGIPWVADFRDGWYIRTIDEGRKSFFWRLKRRMELFYEKKYMATASMITTVDPVLAGKISRLHQKDVEVVFNGYEKFYDGPQMAVSAEQLRLGHSGTVYKGHQVEILLRAIGELHRSGQIRPQDLMVFFWGLEFFPQEYHRVWNFDPAVRPYLFTTPRLPHAEVLKEMTQCDLLVVFTDPMYSLIPTKTYEYISLQKPVLVIMNDFHLMESLIKDLEAGFLMNDISDLKEFLLKQIAVKQSGNSLTLPPVSRERAACYSRRNQAKDLAGLLQSRFGPSTPSHRD